LRKSHQFSLHGTELSRHFRDSGNDFSPRFNHFRRYHGFAFGWRFWQTWRVFRQSLAAAWKPVVKQIARELATISEVRNA
jgi:hypothetical protein